MISEKLSREETHRIFKKHGILVQGIAKATNHGRLLAALIEGVDENGRPHLTLGEVDDITKMEQDEWDRFWEELEDEKKIWNQVTEGKGKRKQCLLTTGQGDDTTFRTLSIIRSYPVFRNFINKRLEETDTDTVDTAWFTDYLDHDQHVVLGHEIKTINSMKLGDFPLHPDRIDDAATVNRGILTLGDPVSGTKVMKFFRKRPYDEVSIRLYHRAYVDMSRTGASTGGVLHGIENATGTATFGWETSKRGNVRTGKVGGDYPGEHLWGYFFPDDLEKFFGTNEGDNDEVEILDEGDDDEVEILDEGDDDEVEILEVSAV